MKPLKITAVMKNIEGVTVNGSKAATSLNKRSRTYF
jgi:hypothetical protein